MPEPDRRSVLQGAGVAALAIVGGRGAAFAAGHPAAVRPVAARATAQGTGIISIAGAPAGTFGKVRIADDDTRLELSYPSAAGMIAALKVPAPAYYGLDFTAFPAHHAAERQLQDVFDNTPFSFIAFYFQTTGHPGGSWHGKAKALLDQGWSILPIYVGRQQTWPHNSDNVIAKDVSKAASQGRADGSHALRLAASENLPSASLIFLDIEPTRDAHGNLAAPGPQTIAYIDAWLATAGRRGALYDTNAKWTVKGHTYYDAPVIRSMISSHPDTWVSWGISSPPPGVKTSQWPLDNNGDVCPVAIRRYATSPRWDFAGFAQLWQFSTDWPAGSATIITDTGTAYPLSDVVRTIDLDSSRTPDPARTAGSRPKEQRRAQVSKITVAASAVKPGTSTQVTVTLDRTAPGPNGTVVLLRCDTSEVILPSAARIAAGQDTATVTAAVAIGAPTGPAHLTGRTLYQLTKPPAGATLTIAGAARPLSPRAR